MSNIIVVAEGDEFGGALALSNMIKDRIPTADIRVTILGHIQRGGSPTSYERILASRLGFAAVESLLAGHTQEMLGIVNNKINYTPFAECVKKRKPMAKDLLTMIDVLSK